MTKEYKLGDTIYVKYTIAQIDEKDHEKTYGIKFAEKTYGVQTWPNRSAIIDELPTAEPVKPVLPKEVGEELDIAKNELQISFDVYIGNIINRVSSAKASYHYYIFNINAIIKLADAWRYGYTVEPETKLYNLVLGFNTHYKERATLYKVGIHGFTISIDTETTDDSLKHDDSYQFTQEEIDRYNENLWIKNLDLNKLKVEVKY